MRNDVSNENSLLKLNTSITVRLVKTPRPDVEYPVVVRHDDGEHIVVVGPWVSDSGARDMGFVLFEPGDVWTEHYWRSRWYSIKEVRAGSGAVKGWYCDVTRPPTVHAGDGEGPSLVVGDLDLDLWLSGDTTQILRLDEDEFAESGLTEREPETAAQAVASLDELEAMARCGAFPMLLAW
jgi:hypothetical protein